MSRRKFFQGTSALAVAAAVGIPLYKGIKEYGPIDIRLYFFSNDPIAIKGALLADHDRDLFRVRAFNEKEDLMTADLKLSDIQKIISVPEKKRRVEMTVTGKNHFQKGILSSVSTKGMLQFFFYEEHGEEGQPIWLMLEDVTRVL